MDNQTEKMLVRLARSIYELILSAQNKEELVAYKKLALEANSIFDNYDNEHGTLHPDLGFTILEFAQLKIDDNKATSDYEENSRLLIEELEKKYGIDV